MQHRPIRRNSTLNRTRPIPRLRARLLTRRKLAHYAAISIQTITTAAAGECLTSSTDAG